MNLPKSLPSFSWFFLSPQERRNKNTACPYAACSSMKTLNKSIYFFLSQTQNCWYSILSHWYTLKYKDPPHLPVLDGKASTVCTSFHPPETLIPLWLPPQLLFWSKISWPCHQVPLSHPSPDWSENRGGMRRHGEGPVCPHTLPFWEPTSLSITWGWTLQKLPYVSAQSKRTFIDENKQPPEKTGQLSWLTTDIFIR